MPQSVAFHHYPQVVWRGHEKRLWNPIHRNALKNRPEERVRLRLIEYLMLGGWSKHRISTEEAVDLPQREAKHRTDLICYTERFEPHLLIECKAENITLSDQTARQIARYNQRVGAPFLLMSNGQTDHWYSISDHEKVEQLEAIPDSLPANKRPETDFDYWKTRGFAGSNANPDLRKWLAAALDDVLLDSDARRVRHLSFNGGPGDIELTNYYRLFSFDDGQLALGYTATEFGGSRTIGILNRNGTNEAVLEINLDLLFDERAPNASIYWADGTTNIDLRNQINPIEKYSASGMEELVVGFHALLLEIIE